jgi:TRAP-type C4-dicarboxylate transport system permease small subunit
MNKFKTSLDKIFNIVLYFCMVLVVAMVVIVFSNVVLRYGFHKGIKWGEEIPLVIVIWFTFIAMALGVKENLHISITLLPKNLPSHLERGLRIFKYLCEIILGCILFYYGLGLAKNGLRSFLPATHITNAVNYIVLPINAIFIILYATIYLVNAIKAKDLSKSEVLLDD